MTPINLKDYEWRWWSQHGEDGVLRKIFELIEPKNKNFIEIGAHFHEANCLKLFQHDKWRGFFFDLFHEFPPLGFYKYRFDASNINFMFGELVRQVNIPYDIDILSIDVDGIDFYLWHALHPIWRPAIVIMECNPQWGLEDKIIEYDPNFNWDGSIYSGASATALYNLAQEKEYSLIHIETTGVNMFFLRNDLLESDMFDHPNDLEFYWNQVNCTNEYSPDLQNRPIIESQTLLKCQ